MRYCCTNSTSIDYEEAIATFAVNWKKALKRSGIDIKKIDKGLNN
ncbi:MAG: hypothetical protein K0S24_2987 [Sphingobacterium sp.]|jgi:hypothetical protein|nr:hypothetical protein [Sphingobacterium sp.]